MTPGLTRLRRAKFRHGAGDPASVRIRPCAASTNTRTPPSAVMPRGMVGFTLVMQGEAHVARIVISCVA
jgi:hypothetical protein